MGSQKREELYKDLKDWGKRHWRENEEKYRSGSRLIGHAFAIFWLILCFYFLNKYYGLIPFLTDDFKIILWILNISLVFSMLSNFVQALTGLFFITRLLRLLENGISFVVFYTTYIIFPFNVGGEYIMPVRLVLIFIMIGIGIGAIVELSKLISGRENK